MNNNHSPTGGVGEVVQGDTDEPPESEDTPEPTPDPITTTDKDGHTITTMPTQSKTTSSKTRKISPDSPPGGVQMKNPSVFDGYQLYKIGDKVTFAWNYTSLQVTPTALNIEAFCTLGARRFDIASNVSADTTEVVWDTGKFQQTALGKLPV